MGTGTNGPLALTGSAIVFKCKIRRGHPKNGVSRIKKR
jgi:hypothetical protein